MPGPSPDRVGGVIRSLCSMPDPDDAAAAPAAAPPLPRPDNMPPRPGEATSSATQTPTAHVMPPKMNDEYGRSRRAHELSTQPPTMPVASAVNRIQIAVPMVTAVAAFSAVSVLTVSAVLTPTAPAVIPRAAPRVVMSTVTANPANAPARMAPHCVRLLQTASEEGRKLGPPDRPTSPGVSAFTGLMRLLLSEK